MNKNAVQPQPGKTYIMHTTAPRTIVFTFVNPGHFIVNGEDIMVSSFSDLAMPYTIASGPYEHTPK